MEQINKEKFEELLKGDKPLVCDFFATWCAPCRMLAPVMEQAGEKFGDRAVFVKIDIDQEPELAVRYGIMSIPNVTVFKGGEPAGQAVGYMNRQEAEEFLEKKL